LYSAKQSFRLALVIYYSTRVRSVYLYLFQWPCHVVDLPSQARKWSSCVSRAFCVIIVEKNKKTAFFMLRSLRTLKAMVIRTIEWANTKLERDDTIKNTHWRRLYYISARGSQNCCSCLSSQSANQHPVTKRFSRGRGEGEILQSVAIRVEAGG
jgi:hypothetical protein